MAAMEYRAAFITQTIGMMLNDGVYFIFWIIFFDRFQQIRGWGLNEMFLLFGVVASGVGLAGYLFGNATNLADVIAKGQLDYYLSLPQPVLIHTLASRSVSSGLGDFFYGLLSFALARQYTLAAFVRFILGALLAMTVFISFMVLVQSLAFWLGNAQMLGNQVHIAMITFSIYPINLFEGSARFILFTLLPAAFIGALPAEFVRSFSWGNFLQLLAAAGGLFCLSTLVFYRGLRRYESGSAIQSQV
jgi:ABC-2 type transport system permease protein